MGVMSAARARLGLHLSSEKNISSLVSQFMRRSSTCSSIVPESSNQEKKKSVYLSFVKNESADQCVLQKCSHIVRPIKFDDSKVKVCKDVIQSPVFECSNKDLRYYRSNTVSTRFGSRILFQNYGERHISWIDPTTHSPQFQVSSQMPSLPNRTYRYMDFGEIDHKLYCIRDDDTERVFEVLESDNWRPLIPPPEGCSNIEPEEFLFMNRSKKILYWRYWKCGVYVYDVTEPEKGWVESNHPTLRDALPFLVRSDPLFLSDRLFLIDDLHHRSLGNFNLVFNLVLTDVCDRKCGVVYPFLLSETCDTFECINNPIDLPPEMKIRGSKFVNLGDQKFCIVVHDPWETTIVLTYEYDVIVSSCNVLEIQTRLLGTRSFRTRDDDYHCLSHIVGAYLL